MAKKIKELKPEQGRLQEVPTRERWLFDQRNRAMVDELMTALKQKAEKKIDLHDFEEKE